MCFLMRLALQRFALGSSSSRCCTWSWHKRGHPLAWSLKYMKYPANTRKSRQDGNTMKCIWNTLPTASQTCSSFGLNWHNTRWESAQEGQPAHTQHPQGLQIYQAGKHDSQRKNQNALIFWDACAYPTSSLAGGYVSSRPGLPCWALNKNVVCGFKRKQQTCCWVLGCLGCTRIIV